MWEETIILLPDNVHYVFLSATIPNARQFAEWICHLHSQVSIALSVLSSDNFLLLLLNNTFGGNFSLVTLYIPIIVQCLCSITFSQLEEKGYTWLSMKK